MGIWQSCRLHGYIPQKSGHISHTIKNYVLGELKRYIRYNSLKLTFLKIRTKFFSRLRNRGFKKVWLRKQFATLKYEDREKLMSEKESDSSFSNSACQTLLEKEAESLKVMRSRWADEFLYPTDKATKRRSNPHSEPLNTKRGKPSGHNNPEVLSITTLHHANEDYLNVVTQGIPWEKLYPQLQQVDATTAAAPSTKTMAREKEVEENGRGRKLNKEAAESRKSSTLYLIMPSYAEAHKKEIKKILQNEKAKLCSNKTFAKVFEDVDFNIAFSNSKNLKKLIVRTKI